MLPSRKNSKAQEARRCKEAMRNLVLAYRTRVEDAMRPAGVTLPQLRALHAIAEQSESSSAAAIARRCQVTPQTQQSILTRLTREGWIVRGSSERNGRIVTAVLTDAGRAILELTTKTMTAIDEEIWRGIPLAEMEKMRLTIESGLSNLGRHAG